MNADEQAQLLKNVPPLSKYEKRRRFRTGMMLAISVLVSILFLIYAFVQKMEADVQYRKATQAQLQAEQARMEADQQRVLAIQNEQEAMKQRLLAEQALADCQRSKR